MRIDADRQFWCSGLTQTRITAGEWRGRVITTPAGNELRPTRSLVREALFNILSGDIPDCLFLDLYAGAGTVGFEALSRGAASVTFVEKRREALGLIASTVQRFKCEDRIELINADAVNWLRAHPDIGAAYDVVFLDAPYRDESIDAALTALGASPPALVVCEHHSSRPLAEHFGALRLVRQVHYGTNELSFFRPSGGSRAE